MESLFCAIENSSISDEEVKRHLFQFLDALGTKENVLLIPPDFTRFHSQAGKITQMIHQYYTHMKNEKKYNYNVTILPALGTHAPMTQSQIRTMFGDDLSDMEPSPFVVHDWRNDVITIGHAPAEMVHQATNGFINEPWPAQLNSLIWSPPDHKKHDLIISIGQVVPHEVMGMANFNKNLFVGVGGVEAINLSHFIGAVHGMENLMGQADNPLRSILNYASEQFLQGTLPLWYILTVMGTNKNSGELEIKGFYIGNDIQCYMQACDLSLKVNFTMLDKPLDKVVVYLDPHEFHSTWLGNKAIYRTRMAIADGGDLIILAPGVNRFGEDSEVDILIRKYGYRGTDTTMKNMQENEELQKNLSAVAHLIHGSSENRFNITYCPGHLSKEDVEGVGFMFDDLSVVSEKYNIETLQDGWNTLENGETFYYISNPALGLWSTCSRFEVLSDDAKDTKIQKQPNNINVAQQNSVDGSGGVGGWKKAPSSFES